MPANVVRNRILLALPSAVREQIASQSESIELASGHTLYLSGAPVHHVYFIESGLVSLIKTMEDGRCVEVAAVGPEGAVGLFAAHGFPSAVLDYVVQVPGSAWRVSTTIMRREMLAHQALQRGLSLHLFLIAEQMAQTAACNGLHSLEQRCCRWLLFAQDSSFTNEFKFTHAFLATLLGVQRSSLSIIAKQLRERGLITYRHGRISILDRPALETATCECYQLVRERTEQVFSLVQCESDRRSYGRAALQKVASDL
jgi:CRP-like cAMP-binding protein